MLPVDEAWRHYTQWNKTDTEGQILYGLLTEGPREVKFTETGSRMVAASTPGSSMSPQQISDPTQQRLRVPL
jgi:hypothetical protein